MAVLLKGFDVEFQKANALLGQLAHRLTLENSKPKVWTKEQVADLIVLHSAHTALWNAISEMANQIRDD